MSLACTQRVAHLISTCHVIFVPASQKKIKDKGMTKAGQKEVSSKFWFAWVQCWHQSYLLLPPHRDADSKGTTRSFKFSSVSSTSSLSMRIMLKDKARIRESPNMCTSMPDKHAWMAGLPSPLFEMLRLSGSKDHADSFVYGTVHWARKAFQSRKAQGFKSIQMQGAVWIPILYPSNNGTQVLWHHRITSNGCRHWQDTPLHSREYQLLPAHSAGNGTLLALCMQIVTPKHLHLLSWQNEFVWRSNHEDLTYLTYFHSLRHSSIKTSNCVGVFAAKHEFFFVIHDILRLWTLWQSGLHDLADPLRGCDLRHRWALGRKELMEWRLKSLPCSLCDSAMLKLQQSKDTQIFARESNLQQKLLSCALSRSSMCSSLHWEWTHNCITLIFTLLCTTLTISIYSAPPWKSTSIASL